MPRIARNCFFLFDQTLHNDSVMISHTVTGDDTSHPAVSKNSQINV